MISVIIPLFNEYDNIKLYNNDLIKVVNDISNGFNESVEFIFVDDGSTDKTFDELQRCVSGDNIRYIQHPVNMGLGMAIRSGIKGALGDKIITIDADLTFKPSDIKLLLEAHYETDADCISGSPYLRSDLMEDVTFYRLILSKCANYLCKFVLWNNNITCVSPIFRLYKKSIFDNMKLISNNFEINAEIMSKILISGGSVIEVPTVLLKRKYGSSKIDISREVKNYFVLFYRIIKMKYLGLGWE